MTDHQPPAREPIAGRYVLLDQIGYGAMGTVWRVWDIKRGDHVAAKVLSHHSSSMLLRFVREQGLRIDHPHVVAPTSWAAEDDLVVFTMDLVRGGSLAQLLETHGPLPEEYAAVLLDQLLAALGAVHAAGVVHRDVKPANILLEPTGRERPHLRLGDFGVAVPLDDARLTHSPAIVGTDGYMPPEQAAGQHPDPQQDLYAAGVVIVECLTGRVPRAGEPVVAPPGALHAVLTALTAPAPQDRPPSADAARALVAPLVPLAWRPGAQAPDVPDRITAPAKPGPTRVRPKAPEPVRVPPPPQPADTRRPAGFAVDPIAAEALEIRLAQRAVTPLPSHLQTEPFEERPHNSGMTRIIAAVLIVAVMATLVLSVLISTLG